MTAPLLPHGDRLQHYRHFAMNCDWAILLDSADHEHCQRATAELFSEVDRLEQELSRFHPGSDIGQFNLTPAGTTLKLGIEAFECLLLGLQLFQLTDGAFDISLGSGLNSIEVYTESRSVRKRDSETALDLGGLGKGYALDRLIDQLHEWDLDDGVAHCGQSTVSCFGSERELAVRHPRDPQRTLGHLSLGQRSFSGSSNALYSAHVLDPSSQRPPEHAIASWCVAPNAALSDAFATCGLLLPSDKLRALCQNHPQISLLLAQQASPLEDLELEVIGSFPELRSGA